MSLLSHAYTDRRLEWNEDEMLSAAKEIRIADEEWLNVGADPKLT